MTVTDWLAAVGALLSAGAAWIALCIALHNAYVLRREMSPRVEMVPFWDLPRDAPEAAKGFGYPATSEPGRPVFRCEITNVGRTGVKIREVRVWIDAPPGKPIQLHLPEGEPSRKLENGDSQTWSSEPFDYRERDGWPDLWTHVMALDTVGNIHEMRNPAFRGYSSGLMHPTS